MDISLPRIPLVDIGAGGPLALLHAERGRAEALLAHGLRRHGRTVMRLGDRISRAWLGRAGNPFRHEIQAVAEALGAPGAVMLNLSFEWTCTSGVAPDPAGGVRLLRALDWPLDGLGRNVVVAREDAPAGPFYNVTWPGAVGVLTAMAPGRFAAAINQAPMRRHGLGLIGDWARNRLAVWNSRALPPAHLLRTVFRDCATYDEALTRLVSTPLVLPALFALAGVAAGQGAIVERTEDRAVVHRAPATCANRFLSADLHGRPRGRDNFERERSLAVSLDKAMRDEVFSWVVPPVLNRRTRLAVVANPVRATLAVLGYERERPATRVFEL